MRKIEDIEKMSLNEIKVQFDEVAQYTTDALSTWQKIYEWKQQELLNNRLEKINNNMLRLTVVVTILTGINVIAAIMAIFCN